MKIKWNSNLNHIELLKDIKTRLKFNDDGSIIEKPDIKFYIDALFSGVIHTLEIDQEILFIEFCKSIRLSFKKDNLRNPDNILLEFNKLCQTRLEVKNQYYLVTTLDVDSKLKSRTINGCNIRFSKNLPKNISTNRTNLFDGYPDHDLHDIKDYTFAIVSVSSSDSKSAFTKSISALDIYRGIKQIGFKKTFHRIGLDNESMYPTNSIFNMGKAHTLHNKNGSLASKDFWYDKFFHKNLAMPIKNNEKSEYNFSFYLKKLNKNPFRSHIENALKNYINALDSRNMENRYMKLWSTIEGLVKSDDSNTIIKRVSFFYENRNSHKQYLKSLRHTRNTITHRGFLPYNIEMKNFRLCIYIEDLLRFFINNPFKHSNLTNFLEFISLSTEGNTIDEQIKNLKKVKKFINN